MKNLFDVHSIASARDVTKTYSTSFYKSVSMLGEDIRDDVHAIYGMVRYADEIVDTFHDYEKETLLEEFRVETFRSVERKISLNPILNAFQATVNKYQIDMDLVQTFFDSMAMDLNPVDYNKNLYEKYILGSAEVVGLMCLKIFVYGSEEEYQRLKPFAMKLGSAFQKINFLRDLKDDVSDLGRVYFPSLGDNGLDLQKKLEIEKEIELEFLEAYKGVIELPKSARFGVYVAYRYYFGLLKKIQAKTVKDLMNQRVRINDFSKYLIFVKSYLRHSFNVL